MELSQFRVSAESFQGSQPLKKKKNKKRQKEATLMLRIQTGCRVRSGAQTSKVVYSALTFGSTIKLTRVREEL